MNWTALVQVILKVFEDNPQLAQSLLSTLFSLFVSNPPLLAKAVNVGLAHAAATVPPPSEHLKVA